jgi:DNA-3-methyladenine glycosylase I
MQKRRCEWCGNDPLLIAYHDQEWGVPLLDDRKIFAFITLDAFQAGLSWAIILRKRTHLEEALAGFDPQIIADFDDQKITQLLHNPKIIRNRAKIAATVANARVFVKVQAEWGSFSRYLWQFVDYQPIVNAWEKEADIPKYTAQAERLSQDLRRRGFQFVGPTICYAFMQAAGLINDHLTSCFRYPEINASHAELRQRLRTLTNHQI